MRRGLLAAIIVSCSVLCTSFDDLVVEVEASDSNTPVLMHVVVIENYSHDSSAFTQGLLWHQGYLYESTGMYGNSSLREVNMSTGEVTRSVSLNDSLFGEGLALSGDNLVQLTWKNNTALIWNISDFSLVGNFTYEGEGWGICNDGQNLIMSNGTDVLTVREPSNFTIVREIHVSLNGTPQNKLNELECDEEHIWANMWGEGSFLRINSTTGHVEQLIDASILLEDESVNGSGVLNGIAIDDNGDYLLTGKNWPKLFRVEVVPTDTLDPMDINQTNSNNNLESVFSSPISVILMIAVGSMITVSIFLMYGIIREGQTHKGQRAPMRGGDEDER